jgi:DNA primase catalytic core
MGRIAEAELERIKREVSLLERVRGEGIVLRRHGAEWIGPCPFHNDSSPSLVITPSRNLWHCLGACQAGGSVIDWVMRRERVSFSHAAGQLRKNLPGGSAGPGLALSPDLRDGALLTAVVEFYHQTLLQSGEAIAYLTKRGLNHREAIEHFRLGYANRTLTYQLPEGRAGRAVRERLERLGIFRGSGHEHLNGSLVVPVFDAEGGVVSCYGRKIRDDLREGTQRHLYLPGPHRGVWNRAGIQGAREVILCEALLDALSFWVAGFKNVTASCGVSGFTAEHLAAIKASGAARVLIAYDRDDAGESAAGELAGVLLGEGLRSARVVFPQGTDVNAFALAHEPAARSLDYLLRQAVAMEPATSAQRQAPPSGDPGQPASSLAASVAAGEERGGGVGGVLRAPPHPPPSPAAAKPPVIQGEDIWLERGERRYRVRGLLSNTSPDLLKVNLLVRRGERVHVDTLDLYAARPRAALVAQAAAELDVAQDVVRKDLGSVLLQCEALLAAAPATAAAAGASASAREAMSPAEREAALALLRDPALLDRILADMGLAGVVGEETNKLVGYLAALSRKLSQPLALIVQSASAAGKTSLVNAILALVPPEETIQYSAVTAQALFYLAETDLRHKVLSIVEEAGAERASYALRLLQSEGELSIASTGKDPKTGKLVTHGYRVEGPVMIVLTTTAVDLDEELVNRALVLAVDETQDQTRAIHDAQRRRRTLEGRLAQAEREILLRLHQNAQRLLDAVAVVNPYAPQLTFTDAQTRARRDHEKYLTLIDAIALLHQHQREKKRADRGGVSLSYIEVSPSDIALANRLAAHVLGHSLDELPPQTRRCLTTLDRWVGEQCERHQLHRSDVRFLARDVREVTSLGATQVKLHLRRLVELEYVLVHRAPRGQGVGYELVYEGQGEDGTPFLTGLIDAEQLARPGYDVERSASHAQRSGPGRLLVGGVSGGGRSAAAAPSSLRGTTLGVHEPVLLESAAHG